MRTSALARGALVPLTLLALGLLLGGDASGYPERTTWDREFLAPDAGDLVLADVTGDGWTDLAAVDEATAAVWMYMGSASGLPSEPQAQVSAPGVVDLAVGDVDGDERLDLLAVDGHTVTRFAGVATWVPFLSTNGLGAYRVAVADFNGDGRKDVALLLTRGVGIWIHRTSGGFAAGATHIFAGEARFDDLAAGDLDGDGRDDLAIARGTEWRVYRQGSVGIESTPAAQVTSGSDQGDVALAIVPTREERPMLAVVSSGDGPTGGAIQLWRWDDHGFRLRTSFPGTYLARLAVGDVNDDGRADLAVARPDGYLSVLLQGAVSFDDGTADWTFARPFAASDSALKVAIADVNGDGFEDIMLRAGGSFVFYLQEDAMPRLTRPIPTIVVNRGTVTPGIVNLVDFFEDDHGRLEFSVAFQSESEGLRAIVEGTVLGFETADWYGITEVRVHAWDGNPKHRWVESNDFLVTVNDVPRFTSVPVRRAVVGDSYSYLVQIADDFPADDRATFTLLRAPEGLTIDRATGAVEWTPGEDAIGTHAVAVEVQDGNGARAIQEYEIVVAAAPIASPVPLMALGVAATSTALLGAAALINENARLLFLLFVVPLYSKIKRERVLDHFVRGQVFGYIQANPGEHYNAIRNALGLTNGSLAHHLRTLEREHFVKSKRFGMYRRFYPMNFRLPPDDAFRPNEVQIRIIGLIRGTPGITQKEISDRLGLTPPTVNYHVSALNERNLIRVDRLGRKTHCTVVESTST